MQNKKNYSIICFLIIIIVFSIIFYINFISHKTKQQVNAEDLIGVIETSSVENTSKIKMYSFDGKLKQNLDVDTGDINSGFLNPVKGNDSIYINSLGTYDNQSKNVIEYNLKSNNSSSYEITFGILSIAKHENFIFTTNSPPQNSIITKYDIDKETIADLIELPSFITHINVLNNQLYAFGNSDSDNKLSELYIIDIDLMEIVKK